VMIPERSPDRTVWLDSDYASAHTRGTLPSRVGWCRGRRHPTPDQRRNP
jgi:hypothetical protein